MPEKLRFNLRIRDFEVNTRWEERSEKFMNKSCVSDLLTSSFEIKVCYRLNAFITIN